jgi:hypothetical protein
VLSTSSAARCSTSSSAEKRLTAVGVEGRPAAVGVEGKGRRRDSPPSSVQRRRRCGSRWRPRDEQGLQPTQKVPATHIFRAEPPCLSPLFQFTPCTAKPGPNRERERRRRRPRRLTLETHGGDHGRAQIRCRSLADGGRK